MQLVAYLINPADNNESISAIGRRLGATNIQYDEEVYGKGAKQSIPEFNIVSEHVSRKASAIYQLKDQMNESLNKNEQSDLFYELELPLAKILAKMEYEGVQVDEN